MSQREALLILSNPVDGKDAEFREWYWGIHIPEVLGLPVIEAAHRYSVPDALRANAPQRYATLYDVKGSAAEAMNALFTSGLSSSDTLDVATVVVLPLVVHD
ncbi:hypothetical protein [Cryptosporangium sp. NPDC048952]|uniref:hypothetical protein n=1 Tax=Cryptosporangium sp. NPDC048952 TaxID=3363961 RepID=UPI003716581B